MQETSVLSFVQRQHEQELKKWHQKQKAEEEKRRDQQKRVADMGSINNERAVVPPHDLPIPETSPAIVWPDNLLNDGHSEKSILNDQFISNDSLPSYSFVDINSAEAQPAGHFLK